jgi:hypothetical protein
MNALIKTFAATPYQYNSAKSFRLEHSKTIYGQLVCWQHFNTVDDARDPEHVRQFVELGVELRRRTRHNFSWRRNRIIFNSNFINQSNKSNHV